MDCQMRGHEINAPRGVCPNPVLREAKDRPLVRREPVVFLQVASRPVWEGVPIVTVRLNRYSVSGQRNVNEEDGDKVLRAVLNTARGQLIHEQSFYGGWPFLLRLLPCAGCAPAAGGTETKLMEFGGFDPPDGAADFTGPFDAPPQLMRWSRDAPPRLMQAGVGAETCIAPIRAKALERGITNLTGMPHHRARHIGTVSGACPRAVTRCGCPRTAIAPKRLAACGAGDDIPSHVVILPQREGAWTDA